MAGFPFITASVSAGDDVLASQYNNLRLDLIQVIQDEEVAGETINGATLPVACYLDEADGEWKACDGNDSAKVRFGGFAVTNGVDAGAITIQLMGIVGGFSALTKGADYYVQDDKTLGTAIGTISIFVGIAISTTEIVIMGNGYFVDRIGAQTIAGIKTLGSIPLLPASNPTTDQQATRKKYVDDNDTLYARGSGSNGGSSTTDITIAHGLGRTPKMVMVQCVATGLVNIGFMSIGSGTAVATEGSVGMTTVTGSGNGGFTSGSIAFVRDSADSIRFAMDLKTLDATNIVFQVSASESDGAVSFIWEAWA